jgi:hypothetical protein
MHCLTKLNYLLLVPMVTSLSFYIVVKQRVHLWDPLLHRHGFTCHTKMVWLLWLQNLTLHNSTLTVAGFTSISEIRTSIMQIMASRSMA